MSIPVRIVVLIAFATLVVVGLGIGAGYRSWTFRRTIEALDSNEFRRAELAAETLIASKNARAVEPLVRAATRRDDDHLALLEPGSSGGQATSDSPAALSWAARLVRELPATPSLVETLRRLLRESGRDVAIAALLAASELRGEMGASLLPDAVERAVAGGGSFRRPSVRAALERIAPDATLVDWIRSVGPDVERRARFFVGLVALWRFPSYGPATPSSEARRLDLLESHHSAGSARGRGGAGR